MNREFGEKDKKKRIIEEVDKSPPASTSTNPSSSSTKSSTLTRIAPIIYFKLGSEFLINKSALSKQLEEINNFLKIEIKDFKITANGNLLVYLNIDIDKQKLFNSKIFDQYRKIDLGAAERRPQAVLKGMSAQEVNKSIDKVKIYGMLECLPLNDKNPNANICKVIFDSIESKNRALLTGFILIEKYIKTRIEDFKRPPIQWFRPRNSSGACLYTSTARCVCVFFLI